MKYFLWFIVIICHLNLGLAHNPHECFFDIKIDKQSCTITAEFPWTLRNALLNFDPVLKNAQQPQAFEQAFEKYISSHLILKDTHGKALVFKGYKALENNVHSHQNEYVLTYEGGDVNQVTNTIMFEMSDKQSNYHSVLIDGTEKNFETFIGQDSFMIDDLSVNYSRYFVFGFLVIGIIGIFVYKFGFISKAKVKENIF